MLLNAKVLRIVDERGIKNDELLTYNSKCLNYRVKFTSIVVYAILPLVSFDHES